MKRSLLFALGLLVSTMLLFTACTDDEDPVDLPPSISFVAGAGYISNDATLTVDMPFTVKILAEANATSNSKIQSLKITRVFSLNTWDTTLTFNETTLSMEVSFIAVSVPGVERITFKVTDKDGQSASKELDITTEESSIPINTFTMRILGSYQSATGSSFASIDGNVYTLAQAFANQGIIDFLYWWGASTSATIGAPDDDLAAQVFTGVNGLPNWSVKNGTRFTTTTFTAAEFDALDDGAPIIAAASGADQTRAGSLETGHVIAFKTVTGKYGVLKVVGINTGAAGDITIDVKVEQ